ncbi:MAG: DUF1844 domain-containing protein [Deltaproteobacteria bacterium]|nr:DUF1844 domain-containing protein [Candidatus Dadabacteria bacterium]MCH8956858.1 DUF1844 domain-containing protein [candidate division KSB1 bacterium]TDI95998.1 MAG: DUF1844 domain-containing protein [Deltaproteobacteria bacterium]TDJ05242.1 MAG: DUF1844 domain-containing protein [Deltaproteobacteria bacterium]
MADQKRDQSKIDFSNFILSLNTSALIHLGDLPDPQTRERIYDIQSAKQTVDILELLKTKTEGNLDSEEFRLLDDVIYDLRLKYVKIMQSDNK